MPRFDVTTIGEGQLRYSVPKGYRLADAPHYDVNVTGTEANVTSLLARLGWNCGWITALPNSPLGQRIANEYGSSGLDLSSVVWSDKYRVATYYVEFGVPPKSTQVYYDRENTCFVNLTSDDIDWDYLLDTKLLHLSGLTVPLSSSLREILLHAVRKAKERGIKISFDMNYRSRIWSTSEAVESIKPFLDAVDILFFARGDAKRMYGFDDDSETVLHQISGLTNAQYVVVSLSKDGIVAWDRDQIYHQASHNVEVIDRIGAGDAMVAGVLHGYLQGDFVKALQYGVMTAALALTHYGDRVMITGGELEEALGIKNPDIVR